MNLSGTRSLTGRKTGSAGKYPALAAAMRERIVAGAFLPGERLPRAHELQLEFDTTKVTALRAVAVLAGQGFLRTEERAGVFVADHPPHLSHFAMAFPWGARHMQSQFFGAIEREAARLQAPERRVTMFHDMAEHAEGTEAQRLCRLAEEHRLAGIVFAHNPYMLDHSPIVQESGIPRVAIAMADDQASMPTVYPDLDEFWRRALERLAAHGRRRLAILMLASGRPDPQFAALERQCARYGLTTRPEWVHGFCLENAAWAASVARLLFRGDASDRPDALLIADDNFVEPATAGVAAAGVAVPRDLNIVAMANFPYPTECAVPVERLGFDIRRLVAVCMDLIAGKRCGAPAPTPAHTAIPAIFEAEHSTGDE